MAESLEGWKEGRIADDALTRRETSPLPGKRNESSGVTGEGEMGDSASDRLRVSLINDAGENEPLNEDAGEGMGL